MKYIQLAIFVGIAIFSVLALFEAIKDRNKGMAYTCVTTLIVTIGWAHAWYIAL